MFIVAYNQMIIVNMCLFAVCQCKRSILSGKIIKPMNLEISHFVRDDNQIIIYFGRGRLAASSPTYPSHHKSSENRVISTVGRNLKY